MLKFPKTKKSKLKVILYPLLEHHHELMKTTANIDADMSTVYAATPSEDSVEEV